MSSSKDTSGYTCTLSPDVLEKAKRELNEDPQTRHIEVNILKTRIEKIQGLKPRTDTNFLLRFLRARKFDQERTFQLLKNYYDVRVQSPEMFSDLKPSRVRHVLDDGVYDVLDHRDNNGCKVIVIRLGKWDPDRYTLADTIKALFVIMSKILEEEDTQVNGVHFINNLTGFTLKYLPHVGLTACQDLLHMVQGVLPMRLNRYDFVNEPEFFDIIFTMVKPFMKEKTIQRTILNGDKYDKLHATMNPEFLPTDLGGKLSPYSNKAWMDANLASDAQFEEDNKFGFLNMNVSNGQSVSKSGDAGMQGLGGTFKKLEI